MNAVVTAEFSVPGAGELLEVAPGVLWLRMPLPFDLDHINLYILDDIDGWVVVDCGLGNSDTRAVWEKVIASLLDGKPVKKVILTHAHIDHIGAAGWLCQRAEAPLWITAGEQVTAHEYFQVSGDDSDHFAATAKSFLHRLGMNNKQSEGIMGIFTGISTLIHPLPEDTCELQENSVINIGNLEWQVIISEGHSEAHACLYSEALGVLISGDQVLPRISSNVSVRPGKPEANPLLTWLDSLARLKALPADTLVLPAHERPFYGLRARLTGLLDEHHDTLLQVEQACSEPLTVMQLAGLIYKRKLSLFDLLLAGGECLANLNYLLAEKRVQSHLNDAGVLVFSQRP
ncbi:MBL fold metallo-hydrolase [uncultured Amphritea sp.]|uniref:MBL fold metallo-hydrolase n=1 Tax=uncultured Amphritea sp. TaxID=981605 RepID=UPI002602B070|nr:MBL fold metallo-hydrolase [uncultured Amphritea sp.]